MKTILLRKLRRKYKLKYNTENGQSNLYIWRKRDNKLIKYEANQNKKYKIRSIDYAVTRFVDSPLKVAIPKLLVSGFAIVSDNLRNRKRFNEMRQIKRIFKP